MSDKQQRILVVGPAWVGDMVMAQALFKSLRQANPGVAIDVLAPAWSRPLLARMPEIQDAIELPLHHGELDLTTRYRLAVKLRDVRYQRAIVLPRSLKAALIPWFARIPQRTGYLGELRYGLINDRRGLDKSRLPRTVDRFVALAPEAERRSLPDVPRPALTIDRDNAARVMARLQLDHRAPVVALLPGAEHGPSKQWPAMYYGGLAARLHAAGMQVWLLGSPKDQSMAEQVMAYGPARNLCGETTLPEAIDLIAQVSAVVSNDSGLMHVAAAVGRPVIGIYGSTPPAYAPPLVNNAAVHYLDLPCSPCWERACPYGHYRCLTGIEVDGVYRAVMAKLPARP